MTANNWNLRRKRITNTASTSTFKLNKFYDSNKPGLTTRRSGLRRRTKTPSILFPPFAEFPFSFSPLGTGKIGIPPTSKPFLVRLASPKARRNTAFFIVPVFIAAATSSRILCFVFREISTGVLWNSTVTFRSIISLKRWSWTDEFVPDIFHCS